jgi:hypothetical protein
MKKRWNFALLFLILFSIIFADEGLLGVKKDIPDSTFGQITIDFIDSKDKVSIKAYKKIREQEKEEQEKEEQEEKQEKKSTGNETIDKFFEDIGNTNEQLDSLSIKLKQIQCYLIMVVLEPELLLQQSNNQDFQKTLEFAYDHVYRQNHSIVIINEEVLTNLTATSFIPLLTDVKELADEASSIIQDVNKIKDTIDDLLETSNKLPDEAKKLSPFKAPSVINKITKAAGQLQNMANTTATIIDVIPTTIMLTNALITKKETEIALKMLDKDDSETVLSDESKKEIKILYVDNIRLVINNQLTDHYSSQPFKMEAGKYELSIDSNRYKLTGNNQIFLLKKGKNPDISFIIDDIYWLQNNADFCRKSKWMSLAGTALFSGLGVMCNIFGDAAYSNYESSTNTADVRKYRDQIELFDSFRDLSYKISVVPAVWLIISWINEAKYNKRL